MPDTGYLQIRAFTSVAQLPLQDVAVSVTASDGTAIALRLTDRNGRIPPIPVPVPDRSESLSPDPPETPFTTVNVYGRKKDYEQVEVESVQIFPGTITDQNLEMIPLAELPDSWNQTAVFYTPPQNL